MKSNRMIWDNSQLELVTKRDGRTHLTTEEIRNRLGYASVHYVTKLLNENNVAPVARLALGGRGKPPHLYDINVVRAALDA